MRDGREELGKLSYNITVLHVEEYSVLWKWIHINYIYIIHTHVYIKLECLLKNYKKISIIDVLRL